MGFQIEVYYKVNRPLTGKTAQQKGTAARWYSNETSQPSLITCKMTQISTNITGVSGGHLNPAITVAVASVGKFPWWKVSYTLC